MMISGSGYTATRLGLFARLNELNSLLAMYLKGPQRRVSRAIAEVSAAVSEIEVLLGHPARGLDILEIGSGQQSIQLAALSLGNRAIGIDQESSGKGINLKRLVHTASKDGAIRALKTVVRKSFGFDSDLQREFVKQMKIKRWPKLNILEMDSAKMSFADNSFDVVYSRAVFEHIVDPESVLREVLRIIRPGGVFYCLLHLYTSDSGCHDIRIFSNRRGDLPLWAHLRETHRHRVVENTFLNRLRLGEWRAIFAKLLPGAQVEALMDDSTEGAKLELEKCRACGELSDYSDEELLTVTVKVIWQRAESTRDVSR